MSVQWTKEQERAIASFGKGVAVPAAAGSGKTAVLVERIISQLCDPARNTPADKLLAVTFTNDAAAQMRDKLTAALDKRLAASPQDPWLLRQRDLIQLAHICTIDSFCFELVKENLDKFEYQGGLKILGETEGELIFSRAYDEALEELCVNAPADFALLDNFFGAVEGSGLFKMTEILYGHLRSICHRERWLAQALDKYRSDASFQELKDGMFQEADQAYKRAGRLLEDARYCYNYTMTLQGEEYRFSELYSSAEGNLANTEAFFADFGFSLKRRDMDKLMKLSEPVRKNLTVKRTAPQDIKDIFKPIANRMRDDIKDMCKTLKEALAPFELSDEHYRASLRSAASLFEILVRLEKRVEEISAAMKLERNMADFSDVELMAKELLVTETEEGFERTELAEDIRKGRLYEIILIDEYQDVNDIQEILFLSLSDTDTLDKMGRNTFIVGDLKQAIYGFRKTNPDLFKHRVEQAGQDENSDSLELIRLSTNFRSRPEVLGVSNFLFETLMSRECGEVDYNGDERLYFGSKTYTERPSPAEIMLIDYNEDFPQEALGFNRELYETALRIRQLITEGAPVTDEGKDRPCRPSDFCILVNKNKDIKMAADALRYVGLSAMSEDTAGYVNSREISLALDMLRTVESPMNDIALAAIMMSPIGGFSPDDMAQVRIRCRYKGGDHMNRIYQVLTGASRSPDTKEKYAKYVDMGDPLLQEKCKKLYTMIESLRYCSVSMSLERLIRRIFDMTDLMAVTSVYLDSAKKRANLRLLLEYAADYEENSQDGITGFLRYVDAVSGNTEAFKNAVSVKNPGDCVNVKTYHKSKGLEYPFVFLCTLGRSILPDPGKRPKLRTHKYLGFGFSLNDRRLKVKRRNLYDEYLSKILDKELKSERMRLFYVGCTRAKERLIIVLCNDKAGRSGAETMMGLRRNAVLAGANFERIPGDIVQEQFDCASWAVMALAKHPDREPLANWLGLSLDTVPVSSLAGQADISYHVCEYSDPVPLSPVKEVAPAGSSDPELALTLRERYKNRPVPSGALLPAKLTVTEVVRAEKERSLGDKDPEFYPNLPRLNEELGKLTAAEKGTFTHRFMELADYDSACRSVRDELKRLTDTGKLTKRQAKGVYVESLEKFFRSPFYDRMSAGEPLLREQRFLVSVEDMGLTEELKEYTGGEGFIQGIADCIFREEDGWVLVDYKTDNFRDVSEMSRYTMQLKLYKAAFELILEEPVKASYIYSFKLGEGVEFKL